MISIIITSYKEPRTIGRAVQSVLAQDIPFKYELIVVAPDDETLAAAKEVGKNKIKTLKDSGNGKPAALNGAVSAAKGEILVLTDGDVYVGKDSLKKILKFFEDNKIGAVTGRPVSLNTRKNKYGFWAHVLTEVADERRKKASENRNRFFCSGYFFAIRKNLFPRLPETLLSEDGYISHSVYEQGYKIAYSPESEVYVKYPDNFSDWIKQKKRSAGGYNQIKKLVGTEIRSFKTESLGAFQLFKHTKGIREFFWLIELFLARVYLWAIIYKDINLTKKSHKQIWKRVESTK